MMNIRNLLTFILSLLFFAACNNSQDIFYLDSNFPGLEPKIYAPNILSLPDRNEHGLTIRNNGSEHYFGLDGRKDWTYNGLVCLKRSENNTMIFDTLKFTDNIVAPYIPPDDKYLFFTRRYESKEASTSDIYWVSLDIVSQLKDKIKN